VVVKVSALAEKRTPLSDALESAVERREAPPSPPSSEQPRDLVSEVRVWLAAQGPGTIEQVARGIHARTQDVRAAVRAARDVLPASTRTESRRTAVVYRLASSVLDGQGRAVRPSQTARALSILSDGEWHDRAEFRAAGVECLNSRIADLRSPGRGGHRITCERVGGTYRYRLADGPLPLSSQER
jgi:hypothetical protein